MPKKQNYGGVKKSDLKAKANGANNKKGGDNNFQRRPQAPLPKLPLVYVDQMTVADIATVTKRGVGDIIKALMEMGMLASQNQSLDRDTAELLANELGIEFKVDETKDYTNFENLKFEDNPEDLVPRSPVITIMGHVDHGKTTLLDTIRNTRVVDSEFGGITQGIGAYTVNKDGQSITFIDTPGHAAFTEMRARGAQVTDIVVLVVAADDGVMPQTREAIDHAKAANCPMVVAVNKIDRPNANPDRVKQELAECGVLADDWGGDTPFVYISALRGTNVEELLQTILTVAELQEYKANPKREANGFVIESKLDKTKGPTATLLVKNGTLKMGDIIVCGDTWAKIRAMYNDLNKQVREAGPSTPVSVVGFDDVPVAGDQFLVVKDERQARQISETRTNRTKNKMQSSKVISLEDMFKNQDSDTRELKVIIKADTSGSQEAVKGSIEKIDVDGIKVSVVRSSVGPVTENDVLLAQASEAIIIAFNVQALANTKDFAKSRGIEIRSYNIIYKLIEDIEAAMKGMLAPVYEDKTCGEAEVRETFKVSKVGTIAGCMVTNGFVRRVSNVSVTRDGKVVYQGKIASLKRFKDDAKEVKAGYDCGIMVENFNDIKVGDVLVFTITEEVTNEE